MSHIDFITEDMGKIVIFNKTPFSFISYFLADVKLNVYFNKHTQRV